MWYTEWKFEDYVQWINEPKHIVNPIRDVKLFGNPFLEAITMSPWYLIPIFYTAQILALLHFKGSYELSYFTKVCCLIYGFISWTFLEYSIHRFFFHGEEVWMINLPHHRSVFCFHFLIHGIHHAFPQDRYRLVFPPVPGAIIIFSAGYLPIS